MSIQRMCKEECNKRTLLIPCSVFFSIAVFPQQIPAGTLGATRWSGTGPGVTRARNGPPIPIWQMSWRLTRRPMDSFGWNLGDGWISLRVKQSGDMR